MKEAKKQNNSTKNIKKTKNDTLEGEKETDKTSPKKQSDLPESILDLIFSIFK